jgi:hypothetical protein
MGYSTIFLYRPRLVLRVAPMVNAMPSPCTLCMGLHDPFAHSLRHRVISAYPHRLSLIV